MDSDEEHSIAVESRAASKDGGGRKEKRTSRACLECRKRKSACHLPIVDGVVQTPCQRCKAAKKECVIGSSNRGGRRVRKTRFVQQQHGPGASGTEGRAGAATANSLQSNDTVTGAAFSSRTDNDASIFGMSSRAGASPRPPLFLDPALRTMGSTGTKDTYIQDRELRDSSVDSSGIAFDDLQNPSDALGILAQIASSGEPAPSYTAPQNGSIGAMGQPLLDYSLAREGRLSLSTIIQLLQRYRHYYHPYFPLVPASTLDAGNLTNSAKGEPHLLTAILVIASRDMIDEPQIHASCAEHMQSLVSALAAGGPGDVEAVEALLLLAEWTPYTSRTQSGRVGRGEEDREAWMHVGTALRIGYFLGIDRYSFHVRDDAKDPNWQRKRLAWTACYISDRQISIRLGRAFWSRGPGPLTSLRKEDFPSLQPQVPGDEDYASIFQATLELTLLFSNVHDVLYSNPGNSMRSHLSGGYIKYIDDFRSAIYGWKSVWGTLTCSPHLKATLLMSYDYLRLYTNAFAFHATIRRALPLMQGNDASRRSSHTAPGRVFYNNVGAVGDARFIYEGLDAAKSLLTMINNFVDPEMSLRYMPLRFYLYSIYSGVFLYRARCVGVLAAEEEASVRAMVQETVNRLERSAIGSQHPGSRYSQLLKLLWDKVERKSQKQAGSTVMLNNIYRPGTSVAYASTSTPTPGTGSSAINHSAAMTDDSPPVTEMMGDFSWTDLDAIGNFALNGNGGNALSDAEWWSGFLPADSNNVIFDGTMPFDDSNDFRLQ